MKSEDRTEKILGLMREEKRPMKLNEISKKIGIASESDEYQNLKKDLKDLCDQGVLTKHTKRRYSLNDIDGNSTFKGIIHIIDGRGTVETNSKEFKKVTVKRKHLHRALDGDTVIVKLLAMRDNKKKPRGEVIDIIERSRHKIVGNVHHDGFFYFLVPDEENYYVDFLIPQKKLNGAEVGDKAAANFLSWKDENKSPIAQVREVIGKAGDPTTEYESVLKEFELPEDFPKKVNNEAQEIEEVISKEEIENRRDLRKEEIVTIDPADAKDFDDALSLKILKNGNYKLGVHIADVGHYVLENSEIDIEGRTRGTSVYLVDRVVPMLPEKLSNKICSLRPGEDRLAFSVEMIFSPRGVLKDYEVFESVIRSKRRFNYDEVQEIIDTGEGNRSDLILSLHKLSRILRKRRYNLGGIEFETAEVKFNLDENKYPIEAYLKAATHSTELVEECMLAANQVVAGHVKTLTKKFGKKKLPYLYRIHEEPDPEKLKRALSFVRSLGIKTKIQDISSKDINTILDQLEDTNKKYLVHQILIRAMAKARYSAKNYGHYGLGFDEYTHFTSPIRRYPDLMIHRLLKEYSNGEVDNSRLKFLKVLIKDVAMHSSDRERTAIDAERQSTKLASTIMAEKKVGEVCNGTISGVTNFGLFVMIDDFYGEGLLHIKDLYDDYYKYDEENFCLIGRKTKKKFGFGHRIKVKILSANVERRMIELGLINDVKK